MRLMANLLIFNFTNQQFLRYSASGLTSVSQNYPTNALEQHLKSAQDYECIFNP